MCVSIRVFVLQLVMKPLSVVLDPSTGMVTLVRQVSTRT